MVQTACACVTWHLYLCEDQFKFKTLRVRTLEDMFGQRGHVWTERCYWVMVRGLGMNCVRVLTSVDVQTAVCVSVAPVTLIGGHLTGAVTQTEDTGHTAAAHTPDTHTSVNRTSTSSLRLNRHDLVQIGMSTEQDWLFLTDV